MLGPLASNGGQRARIWCSAAVPPSTPATTRSRTSFDQRGSGYPRVIGSSADIGAYELDTNDVIFVNGFDP